MTEAGALSLYAALLRGECEGDEALLASRQIFELVMNNVEQAIWWKDVNSVYLGCNRKLAEYAGVADASELIGKTDADCPWGQIEQARSGTVWFRDHDRTVVETGRPILGLREQVRIVNGHVMWVETNKVPLKDLRGNVIGTLGTFVDISERIEAENELKRTLAELDERVRDRTSELRAANETLRREVEERVRLEQRERRRRAEAESLRDTAAAIAGSLQLDDVIEQVLRGVEQLFDHRRSHIALYDNEGELELAGQRGPGRDNLDDVEPHARVPDPLVPVTGEAGLSGGSGPVIGGDGTVILPLEVADRRLGYLAVEPLPGAGFSPEEVGLLATIADQASSAISNSRALMMARSLAAVEERQRLANDLHDSVSQTLWTATLTAETLARTAALTDPETAQLRRLHQLTKGALSEMRTLLLELRPDVIEETPLADLVYQLVGAFESRKSAPCRVELEEIPELLPTEKVALYRILQESLNNVARHAEAGAVEIKLATDGDQISLQVSDDGVGFDATKVHEHLGLRIMAERAESIGAKLEIRSAENQGTTVSVTVTSVVRFPR
ncbi:ATP-binding protein [Candidatus Poriferisocius sp.]|uniref:ATP-binding protein n=1 Tax=Candidatus Poriferisocius sp. TaxID=3101276 RepID=UPI003B5A5D3E